MGHKIKQDGVNGRAKPLVEKKPSHRPKISTNQTIMSLGTWQNPFGPGALNNLIFFTVQNNATFSCASIGSRCSFTTSDFGRIDEDGGAIADQEGGSVWTTSKFDRSQFSFVCLIFRQYSHT